MILPICVAMVLFVNRSRLPNVSQPTGSTETEQPAIPQSLPPSEDDQPDNTAPVPTSIRPITSPKPVATSPTGSLTIPGRYRRVVFTSVTANKDITYRSTYHTQLSLDGDGNNFLEDNVSSPTELKLNIYQPSGDLQVNRPALFFIYGGGFVEGDRYQQEQSAIYYAQLGYVTITLDYTMMPPDNTLNPVPDPTLSVYPRLIYKSVNDIYAAYTWAINHKDVYRIDTTRMGVGGWSAGGLISQIFVHGNVTPEPTGIKAVIGLSNVLQPVIANAPPLSGYRSFSNGFTPQSLFASYDTDEGFAGYYNDHEEDCTYLRNIVLHPCTVITYPGAGHPMEFNQTPNASDSVDFFARWVTDS